MKSIYLNIMKQKTQLIFPEYDQEVIQILTNYRDLVNANNSIEETKKIQPAELMHIKITKALQEASLPIRSKIEEMVDKTHQAALQLRDYYDQIADQDAGFIPYWEGKTSFSGTFHELGEIQKRKLFESYSKFFKRNRLEDRIELYNQVSRFNPFFDEHYPEFISSQKEILDKSHGLALTLPTGVLTTIATGGMFLLFYLSTLVKDENIVNFLAPYFCGLAGVGVSALSADTERDREKGVLNYRNHEALQRRCYRSENAIILIKSLSE